MINEYGPSSPDPRRGSPADTALAYCTEIPGLVRNLSTVTLGRVPQLMGVDSSALLFLIRLILLWGVGMEVGPYRVGPPSVSCDPGKGSYYSYYC